MLVGFTAGSRFAGMISTQTNLVFSALTTALIASRR